MASEAVLEGLVDHKVLKILNLFFKDREKKFYLREISIESGVPVATTLRILGRLVSLDIIRLFQIRKFKFYQFSGSEKARHLESIMGVGK